MNRKSPGLFQGWWFETARDGTKRKLRRIRRDEYGELYRLHRLCVMYERKDAAHR